MLAPLRGSDGGFTSTSIHVRLPAILNETICRNEWPPVVAAAIRARLCEPLAADGVLWDGDEAARVPEADCPALWAAALAEGAGQRVSACRWWSVENFAYLRLRQILSEHGVVGDPFASQKVSSLADAEASFCASYKAGRGSSSARGDVADLQRLLHLSLWGNRSDLSLSAGRVEAQSSDIDGALLVDDSLAVAALLCGAPEPVAIILDNVGAELLADLVLVDALLSLRAHAPPLHDAGPLQSRMAAPPPVVTLHCKAAPTFVSDATVADVQQHVAWLCKRAPELGARLHAALSSGALALEAHPFWTSPATYELLPPDLATSLSGVSVALFKGDANYRRLVGDVHQHHTRTLSDVVAHWAPCHVAALRTCKSGVIVGLPPEAEARAAALQPNSWCVSGRFGVIQLAATGQV